MCDDCNGCDELCMCLFCCWMCDNNDCCAGCNCDGCCCCCEDGDNLDRRQAAGGTPNGMDAAVLATQYQALQGVNQPIATTRRNSTEEDQQRLRSAVEDFREYKQRSQDESNYACVENMQNDLYHASNNGTMPQPTAPSTTGGEAPPNPGINEQPVTHDPDPHQVCMGIG